jgi:cation transport ATPase
MPGVTDVYVNPATEMAYVEYDDDCCSRTRLAAALEVRRGSGVAPALHPDSSFDQKEVAVNQLDTRRLALTAGLWLAALYTLTTALLPLSVTHARPVVLWEAPLAALAIGGWPRFVAGMAEALVAGALGGWLFAALYNVLPGTARSSARTGRPGASPRAAQAERHA